MNRAALMQLLGQRVTITHPSGSTEWTGKLIAVGQEPCAVIDQDNNGPRICLPQSFTIAPAEETPQDVTRCPHCPDGHDDPRTKPWSVCLSPDLDGDGQPTTLMVGPSNCSHVAESDAEWLRSILRKARAEPGVLPPVQHVRGVAHNAVARVLDQRGRWLPLTVRQAIADAVIAALPPAETRAEQQRAAIARARVLHPTPAELAHANAESGPYCPTCITLAPCPTRAALDGEDTERG